MGDYRRLPTRIYRNCNTAANIRSQFSLISAINFFWPEPKLPNVDRLRPVIGVLAIVTDLGAITIGPHTLMAKPNLAQDLATSRVEYPVNRHCGSRLYMRLCV